MRRTLSSSALVPDWVARVASTSIDSTTTAPVQRFVRSARLGLWPAIVLSTYAFSKLLSYRLIEAAVLAANLCLIGSLGFLFNDHLDRSIDEANKIHRWFIQTRSDLYLFLGAIALYLVIGLTSSAFVGTPALMLLIVTLLGVIAYSMFLKRVVFLGNLVAAALSLTPGLIIFVDVILSGRRVDPGSINVATGLLVVGFLLLLSREIKFDEFDEIGDRVGHRTTLPMIFGPTILRYAHFILVAGALGLFFVLVLTCGAHSEATNMATSLALLNVLAILSITSYRASSKTTFYKVSRLIMLLVPASIFVSF